MAYQPRLEAPSKYNKYYVRVDGGGYNKCIPITGSCVMPNCVGYAYGRFMEAAGVTECKLSTGNAGTWFGNSSDGYERGSTPRLGAVLCWGKPGAAGHVAIVEQINSDGSITTSNSAYGGKFFYTQTLKPPYVQNSGNYKFQGFIYNPHLGANAGAAAGESKLSAFLKVANSHVGEKAKWVWETTGCGEIEWCAAFIVACAKTIGGILDVIIPTSYSVSYFYTTAVSGMYNSKLLKGPRLGSCTTPQPGDLMIFRDCAHIGIVYQVNGTTITTIEGNTVTNNKYTSKVAQKTYDITSSQINSYYRPDWASVGSVLGDLAFGTNGLMSLYDTFNTRADALIREVGYVSGNKPSISTSDIKLSVINYTPALSSMYSGSSGGVIIDGITDPNAKIIIETLMGKGLNAAAACGICGNIKHESGYRPESVGDYGTSFGICQWHNERGTNMKNFVGSDWASNLTGQLNFLWHDLADLLPNTLRSIQAVPNTEAGARQAADTFVREFERPAEVDAQSLLRQATAVELFNQLIVQQSSGGTVATNLVNQLGQTLTGGSEVIIPSYVNQSGISQNYTNYSYWFSRWANSSVQRKLADMWASQGKPNNRGIATISGYYLLAVTLTFGTTGDLITVVLDDGTNFNAIIADSKGINPGATGESGNKYGHSFGNGSIDVIEWEAVGSTTSHKTGRTIDLTGWKGKNVYKIINRGKFL